MRAGGVNNMKNYKIAVAGTGYVGLSIATLLSQPDIFRYIHPESVIYAGSPYQPLPERYPQHKPYDAETAVWQSIIPHIQFQLQQSYTSYP